MTVPLLILAVFAVVVGWTLPGTNFGVTELLEQARPVGTLPRTARRVARRPDDPERTRQPCCRRSKVPVTIIAFSTAAGRVPARDDHVLLGDKLDPDGGPAAVPAALPIPVHKWWFDELYDVVFVRPTHFIAQWRRRIRPGIIDWIVDKLAQAAAQVGHVWDAIVDRGLSTDRSTQRLARPGTWVSACGGSRPVSCGNTSCSSPSARWRCSS